MEESGSENGRRKGKVTVKESEERRRSSGSRKERGRIEQRGRGEWR